jgi:hypothetical protein
MKDRSSGGCLATKDVVEKCQGTLMARPGFEHVNGLSSSETLAERTVQSSEI